MSNKISFHFLNFFLFLAIFLFSFYSCAFSQVGKSSEKLTRFPGTKTFAKMPPGYTWDVERSIFTYGDSENYLIATYFPVDFDLMKKGWRGEAATMPSMKMRSFQKDDFEAMTMSGYMEREKQQMYMMIMETGYHPMMLTAVINDTTLISQMNVPAIIESIYHDDNFDLDLFELHSYQFDDKICDFQYYFSIPGKKNRADYLREPIQDMDNLGPERISISAIKKMTEEEIVESLKRVKTNVDSKNMIDYNRTNITINGLDVSYIEIDTEYSGKPSYTLYAIIRGEEQYYGFRAITNRDVEEMKVKFLATLKSFKVK